MKNKIRKIVSILLTGTLCVSLVTACQTKNDASESKKEITVNDSGYPDLSGETVSFATYTQWYNTNPGLKEGLAEVEKLTGVKIKVNVYPDDQFLKVANTKLATGEMEDFFAFGALKDLTAQDKLEPLSGDWVSSIDTGVQDTLKYNEQIVGAPYGTADVSGVIYNMEVMEKAGVSIPLNNYNEFMDACEKIKVSGVDPLFIANKDLWTSQILFQVSAGDIFKKQPELVEQIMTNKIKWNEIPEAVELCNRMTGLIDKDYINSNYLSADFNMGLEAVAKGEAGMFFGGSWLYQSVVAKYPDAETKVGMMPATIADDNLIGCVMKEGVCSLFLSKDSKNKEVARQVINTFMSKDSLDTLKDKLTGYSIKKDFENDMNPWVKDFSKIIEENNIPTDDQALVKLKGFDPGDILTAFQSLMAGKPAEDCLNDWYLDMAAKNKAKGTPGF